MSPSRSVSHHVLVGRMSGNSTNTPLCSSGYACCFMALDGSVVVGAWLNRPLTRDEVMLNSVPLSVGQGMNWHSDCFKYQYVFQRSVLGVSYRAWGKQKFVATIETVLLWPSQENDFDLDSDLRVGSQILVFFNSNGYSLSYFKYFV
jgi:hypothetical protein